MKINYGKDMFAYMMHCGQLVGKSSIQHFVKERVFAALIGMIMVAFQFAVMYNFKEDDIHRQILMLTSAFGLVAVVIYRNIFSSFVWKIKGFANFAIYQVSGIALMILYFNLISNMFSAMTALPYTIGYWYSSIFFLLNAFFIAFTYHLRKQTVFLSKKMRDECLSLNIWASHMTSAADSKFVQDVSKTFSSYSIYGNSYLIYYDERVYSFVPKSNGRLGYRLWE